MRGRWRRIVRGTEILWTIRWRRRVKVNDRESSLRTALFNPNSFTSACTKRMPKNSATPTANSWTTLGLMAQTVAESTKRVHLTISGLMALSITPNTERTVKRLLCLCANLQPVKSA